MKSAQVSELNEDQWDLFAEMLNEINVKYYSEDNADTIDRDKNKSEVISDLELLKNDLANHFLVFDNGKAAGWYARRLLGSEANFIFDSIYNEIPDDFLLTVFKGLIEFMYETKKDFIYTSSKDTRIINAMLDSGATVTDKAVYSRIMKEDIDTDNLLAIVKSESGKIKYRLVLFNSVTDEIFDRYLDLYNEVRVDMNYFNPEKKIIKNRDRESLKNKLKYDKGPGDEMYMYMLFDGDEIAAFSSVYIREHKKNVIDHGGGLTAVSRKYRGQNLAKFLKAKMYLLMFEKFPDFEYIMTDTYPWNKYMYSINQEMGFVPFQEYLELKITKESLINFVCKET